MLTQNLSLRASTIKLFSGKKILYPFWNKLIIKFAKSVIDLQCTLFNKHVIVLRHISIGVFVNILTILCCVLLMLDSCQWLWHDNVCDTSVNNLYIRNLAFLFFLRCSCYILDTQYHYKQIDQFSRMYTYVLNIMLHYVAISDPLFLLQCRITF